jgi:hypothetical protein
MKSPTAKDASDSLGLNQFSSLAFTFCRVGSSINNKRFDARAEKRFYLIDLSNCGLAERLEKELPQCQRQSPWVPHRSMDSYWEPSCHFGNAKCQLVLQTQKKVDSKATWLESKILFLKMTDVSAYSLVQRNLVERRVVLWNYVNWFVLMKFTKSLKSQIFFSLSWDLAPHHPQAGSLGLYRQRLPSQAIKLLLVGRIELLAMLLQKF